MKIFSSAVVILALPIFCVAEMVYLKDGTWLEAVKVTDNGDKLSVQTKHGNNSINKAEIENLAALGFAPQPLPGTDWDAFFVYSFASFNQPSLILDGESKTSTMDRTNKGGGCRLVNNEPFPRCNWYDAKAYCGGLLPTVSQLHCLYQSECTGGRRTPTCYYWFWSSDESRAVRARYVPFGTGSVYTNAKHAGHYSVRCRQPCPGNIDKFNRAPPANGKMFLLR